MGGELPGHRALLAAELVEGRADVRVSCGNPAGDLHDEHDRIAEHDFAQDHEESLLVPERRSGLQANVSSVEEHQQEMDDADQELERGDEPVRHPVRGASPYLGFLRDARFVFPVLKRENFEDRLTGIACLAFLWSDKGNQLLREIAISDPNPSVRQSALWACGFAGVEEARALLNYHGKDDASASVRDFARAALEKAESSWWEI
jgi:hypothetical protein